MYDISSIDSSKKSEGTWVEFQGAMFLIAHASRLSFQRELAKLQQPYIRKIEKGTMDPEVSLDIVSKALAKHILLDWKDVGSQGEELKYTPELGERVLKMNDELREFVSSASSDIDNFRREAIASEGKLSESS